MIGYLIEQEMMNALPLTGPCATLLTRIEVDPDDPAFANPTKPIGPVCAQAEAAQAVRDHGSGGHRWATSRGALARPASAFCWRRGIA